MSPPITRKSVNVMSVWRKKLQKSGYKGGGASPPDEIVPVVK